MNRFLGWSINVVLVAVVFGATFSSAQDGTPFPPEPEPGEIHTVMLPGGVPLELVWVDGGEFWMGCSTGDAECEDDEKPRHRVKVDGFWMGKAEMTQRQWGAVMKTKPWTESDCFNDGNSAAGPEQPAWCTSWKDAQEFVGRVGNGLRLPSEAQWEYAARGGEDAARYGSLDGVAWYGGNSGGRAHPVGKKAANGYGLHDMLGNVWEWCQDVEDEKEYEKRSGVTNNPEVTSGSEFRVVRGGSWDSGTGVGRVSDRYRGEPAVRSGVAGFRVVRVGRREP